MSEIYKRLASLGFERKEYSDGWFWVLYPDAEEEKIWLSKALGLGDEIWDGPPDTVFLQISEAGSGWSYCFDADYGNLEEREALDVLDTLEESLS